VDTLYYYTTGHHVKVLITEEQLLQTSVREQTRALLE